MEAKALTAGLIPRSGPHSHHISVDRDREANNVQGMDEDLRQQEKKNEEEMKSRTEVKR